jgi:hypothetical protein
MRGWCLQYGLFYAVGMVGARIKDIVAFISRVGGMVAVQEVVGKPCNNCVFDGRRGGGRFEKAMGTDAGAEHGNPIGSGLQTMPLQLGL